MTLRQALDANKGIGPGFHLLRHVLAIAIVIWHCRQAIWWSDSAAALTASGKIATGVSRASEFNLEDIIRPGVHSLVGMFFALSGFLVAGSALRTRSTNKFLLNRVLRIFPALGAETLLSAFILGPAVTALTLGAYLTHPEFSSYFGNIIGWIHYTLPGVFENNPYPRIVNGQLWTLQPEFWCYLLMAVAMTTGLVFNRKALLIVFCIAFAIIISLFLYDPIHFDVKGENMFLPWYITFLFWIGAVYFIYAEKIPLKLYIFIFSCIAYWSIVFFNFLTPIAGLPLAYIMIYIGMTAFPWWDKLVKSDYSYGIYLYHFPIIQTIIWLLMPTAIGSMSNAVKLAVVFPLSLTASVFFAMLSWRFVERPALGLRKTFARTKSITEETPSHEHGHGFAVPPSEHSRLEGNEPATT